MDRKTNRRCRIWTAAFLALALLIACTLPVAAQDRATTQDDLYVTDDGAYGVYIVANNPGTVGIAKCYAGTLPADFNIPTHVALDGKQIPVREIAYYAFEDHTELQTVHIGPHISYIGGYPFRGCTGLSTIYVAESPTYNRTIDNGFATIPGSVEVVGISSENSVTGTERPSLDNLSYPGYLPVPEEVAPLQEATLEGTNTLRAEAGAAPLELSAWLCQAAMIRATEMALADTMDHLRPDGSDWNTVIGGYWNGMGENVVTPPVFEADEVASKSVQMWRESPGHYKSMIEPMYKQMGAGYAQSPTTGRWYGCQILSNLEGAPNLCPEFITIDRVIQNPPYYAPPISEPTPTPTPTPTPAPSLPPELSDFEMDSFLTWGGKHDDMGYLISGHLTEPGSPSIKSVDSFLSCMGIPKDCKVEISTSDGKLCQASESVGTGYVMRVVKGAEELPYQITCIFRGDVTGNGQAGLTDLVQMAGAFTGSHDLDKPYQLAADLNGDSKLMVTDLVLEAALVRG